MVNSIAKYRNRLRHAVAGNCFDVSLFGAKRGYFPMMEGIIPIGS